MGENERLCAMQSRILVKRSTPQGELESGTARSGARHFVERHFVYYDTLSKVFVELPVRRKVTSSNAFSYDNAYDTKSNFRLAQNIS